MAAQPPLDQHDAWPLLLQHRALARRPRAVCLLAATCRSLRAGVQQHCLGALVLRVDVDGREAAELARWLPPNGHLLAELRLGLPGLDWLSANVSAAPLASALQQAAANAGGLQLQALETARRFTSVPSLLAPWLPARKLTRLELRLHSSEDVPFDSSHAAALAALTGLQQLMVEAPQYRTVDALVPALSGLSRLTALELGPVSVPDLASAVQQLPSQLQRLDLAASGNAQLHDLGRLGALTALSGGRSLSLQSGNALPSGLRELRGVRGCANVAPLLPLSALRLLALHDCQAPAAQLRQLSSISALGQPGGEVQLAFCSVPAANAAAAAWPLLPLKRLTITDDGGMALGPGLTRAALSHLASATGLTHLTLAELDALPASRFAADVLGRLSSLVELELVVLQFQLEPLQPAAPGEQQDEAAEDDAAAAAAAGVQLCAAIAALPRLASLQLFILEPPELWSPAAASALRAATGLTALDLFIVDDRVLDDACLAALLPGLSNLRVLSLSGCGDAGMAVVAELPALTHLDISNCSSLTDAGIYCLIQALIDGLPCLCTAGGNLEGMEGVSDEARQELTECCAAALAVHAHAAAEAETAEGGDT